MCIYYIYYTVLQYPNISYTTRCIVVCELCDSSILYNMLLCHFFN